jgi:tetratricopeptide (TPR) repeat protein
LDAFEIGRIVGLIVGFIALIYFGRKTIIRGRRRSEINKHKSYPWTQDSDAVGMRYCTECGTVIGKTASFCPKCGFNLVTSDSTAIEVEVTSGKEHRTLALNHRLREEWDDAIEEYTKAIELDNNFTLAYFERGDIYKRRGKKSEAIADFEKVVSLSNKPETVEVAKRYLKQLQ